MYKIYINLDTIDEVKRFTDICSQIDENITLRGLDENGLEWCLNAKSLLCSLIMKAKFQEDREHTAHEVDWGTIYVECDKDIYSLLSEFAR